MLYKDDTAIFDQINLKTDELVICKTLGVLFIIFGIAAVQSVPKLYCVENQFT